MIRTKPKNNDVSRKERSSIDGNMKIQWVLFDLDGTLADSLDAMAKAYEYFLGRFGHKGTKKEFEELNGPSLEEIVAILRKRYRLAMEQRELMKVYQDEISRIYQQEIRPFDCAEKVLKDLVRSDYRLALVTSSLRKIAKPFTEKQGWRPYFSRYVFGDEVQMAKPHPMIYLSALKKISALPESVVAIEDSPNGIRSARAAGLFVIGVANDRPVKQLRESGASAVVKDLNEVLSVIGVRNE